jgi:hypothetical protein
MRAVRTAVLVAFLAILPAALLPSAAATRPEGGELLPDLVTWRPAKVYLQVTRKGKRLLRFSNEVVNVHVGPLELRPRADDCNGDGATHDERTAYQRIYRDSNADGRFTRDVDDTSRIVRAGCTRFHASHRHWHFDALAAYSLHLVEPDGSLGRPLGEAQKVSACVIDTERRLPGLPGAPARRYYGPGATGCKPSSVGGISIGWGDRYGPRVTGQHVNVTGLARGVYCLASRADPENRIVEANERNNVRTTRVVLRADAVVWRPYRAC